MSHLLLGSLKTFKSWKIPQQSLQIKVSSVSGLTRNSVILMFPQFKATAQGFYSNRCLFHRKRQCSTLTFKISITKMKIYSMALCSETSVTLLRESKSTLRNKCLSVLTSVSTTFLTSMTLLRRRKRWNKVCLTIGSMLWTSLRWNLALSVFATT